ncbi:hypothetical protein LRS13_07540 [Svornostia abyssi]|uniref:Uncharacterized protein n=1 Tax=Svornostia abyssi TaxID=2898438 RepID=A0ABY5PL64_9ACTN|nr:hypothetical protein LRS13_07540 [Parviterribacteraceae bacterium J379]
MTDTNRGGRIAAAAIAAALVFPAAADAAPSVFSTTAKVVPAGQTPDGTWTQGNLSDEERYLLNVGGFPLALSESNGKTTGGVVGYDVLPPLYRNLFGKPRWLTEGTTGAQPHATCDVAALNADAAILGWQGDEPAYGYVLFQATAAGLGDDPAKWLPKVKELTGLSLASTTNLTTACTSIGGTFVPADTVVAKSSDLASGLTAPLETKVADLTKAKDTADTKVADLTKAKAAADAEVKRLTLEATPFKVAVPSSATLQRGLDVNVTGPPNRPVFIRALVTEKQRRELKIPVKTLGTGTGFTDAKGKAKVIVQPRKDSAPVLLRWQVAIPVQIAAVSGDRQNTLVVSLGA